MRTFLLLLSSIVITFSGWSQGQRIVPAVSGEFELSTDFLTRDQQMPNTVQLTKRGFVNGTLELPASNSALVDIIERDRSDYIRCSTAEMEAARRAADPTVTSSEAFEQWIARRIAEMDAEGHDRRATYEIPYIVHVVHAGENIGVGANISNTIVNAQMQQLNDDYQRMNSDIGNTPGVFSAVVGSMDILFKPAVVDPVGNALAEHGIERINGLSEFGITTWDGIGPGSNTQGTLKPNTFWDPTRYMNIWSCNLGDDLLGYAQFPEAGSLPGIGTGNGNSNTDGVVVLYAAMGSIATPGTASPYNLGRTLTHEVGHWLGLKHIWGDGNCSADDYCADTPNAGAPNYTGAPCTFPGANSCDTGGGDLDDMFQNFMDYSDDGCMNLFTADQIGRIEVVLADDGSGSPNRASLLSSNVGEGGGPSACLAWTANGGTGVWDDFNIEFGGAPCDPGEGCQFNEITAFEVWASESYSVNNFVAGATYTFSMCNGAGGDGTGAMAWVPEFTIVAPSGAVDAFGAGDGDGCSITWTASESGAYIIIINEAGFCGPGSTNEMTDNGYPALTCVSGPEPECVEIITACNAGELAVDDSVAVCPGNDVTMETDGTDTIPTGGDYSWGFTPGVDGTGGPGGGFSIGTGSNNTYTFDASLNGLLATVPGGPYPDLAGTWLVWGFVDDSDDMQCDSTNTVRPINFLPAETPGCDAVEPCSPGTLANSDSMAYCPGESANIATNEDEMIPAAGGFAWQFSASPDGTGGPGFDFYIAGLPTDYTFDASLNGGLGANPDLAGTWYVIGFTFSDTLDINGSFCEFTSTFKPVNFLDGEDPACTATACEDPIDLAISNIGTTTADVSWTAGSVESADWDLELVDITALETFMGIPTVNTDASPYNLMGLASDNVYDVYVRENCPDEIQSDIVITGVMDGPLSGGLPKVIEIYTVNPIADVSIYALGSANNGGGSDGMEAFFPPISLPGGVFITFTSDSATFVDFFGFAPDVIDNIALINGDDAIELFKNGEVVDVFGEITHTGAGAWNYQDGWAYRNLGTGPDGSTFNIDNWSFSGPNALDGETTNATAATPFPGGSYSSARVASDWVGPVRFTTLVDPCNPDLTNPTAVCQDVTVELNAAGDGSIVAADIDNGSADDCGEVTLSINISDFNCNNVFRQGDDNFVTLTVTDENNNTATCNSTIVVNDNVDPVATCADLTVQLDAGGSASITGADIDGGSSDACGIASLTPSATSFDCDGLGGNSVTLTVVDENGNMNTCASTVTVEDPLGSCIDPCDPDLTNPTAVCQDVTVELDAAGAGSIVASAIDGGSSDGCGAVGLSADITTFSCIDVPSVTVTLTVTDGSNNEAECTATVTVNDNIAPTATCADFTVQLDAGGSASITGTDIDNGSGDACGITSLTPSDASFDCDGLGGNSVTLTVVDANGNMNTCISTVTVEDPLSACLDPCVGTSGDDQFDPIAVPSFPFTDVQNTADPGCFTDQYDESAGDDVFYRMTTGTNTDSLIISTCNATTDFDTWIYFVSNVGVLIDDNDFDFNCGFNVRQGDNEGASTVRVDVNPSTEYFVVVDGDGGAIGTFELNITEVELAGVMAPANDTCGGAILVACSDSIVGSTADANPDASLGTCGTSLTSAPGVWYKFIGTGDEVTFSLCGSSFDTKLGVFSGSCTSLECVSGNDDECDTQSEVAIVTTPATEYFVYVTGFDDEAGDFGLKVTCVTPPDAPANDSCAAAIDVACDDVINATTDGASTDLGIGNCDTDLDESPGVWYHFTGTGENVTFSLCGTGFDTKMGVFSGSCESLVCESGNDDFCGLQSEVTLTSVPATDYYVYVTGYDGASGDFTLAVTCSPVLPAPANDTCNGAIAIVIGDEGTCDAGPGYVMTSTATATQTLLATCDGSGNDVDIWYSFTAISSSVSFNAINGFPGIEIFEDGTCGELTSVGCLNNESGDIFGLTEGNDYIAMIWTDDATDTVEFCLEVNPVGACEAGDLVDADSIALCPDSTVTIVTEGEITIPDGGAPAIFFEQGPDGTGALDGDFIFWGVTTPFVLDAGLDGLLDGAGFPDFAGTWYVYGAVTADTTDAFNAICDLTDEYMVVTFLQPGEGDCAPPPGAPVNDTCSGALIVTCGTTTSGSTASATDTDAPETCGTTVTAPGVWYYFEGTGDEVTFSTCDAANFDTKISVYEGSCGDLTCVDGNDDGDGCSGFTSELTISSVPGTGYYIYVHAFLDDVGDFDLTVTCVAPPECPAPTEVTISNIGETTADVSWTPGGDEMLWHIEIVDLTAGDPVTGIPTFSGITDTFFSLTDGVAGNDYAIYVISDCGADSSEWAGPEEFTTLFPVPDNDLCAGAIEIGCESATDGTTLGAGNTDAPADCETTLGFGPGVWYMFTGTGGDVTFSTCNTASFDTKIGVFSGSCGDLTCVDGNDDGPGCSGFSSEVTVPTDAGETYYIYITGFLSASGDFTLSVACAEIPVCEAPTGLMLDDVTDVTADISWTAGDDETLWDLELVDVTGGGSFTGIPTEAGLTMTSYSASGLTPGSSYEVWVRADCGADTSAWVGPLEFTTIIPAPANDLCEGAAEVGCGTVISGTTIDATTTDAPDSFCGTTISAPGVWYYFAGNGDAVTFSTCGTADYDTKLSVFEGECGDLTCVDGNDDGPGCLEFTSEITVVTTPGTGYYVYVHGFLSSTGNFDLSVTCVSPPDNDLCENAEEVTCGSVTSGTTEGATETGEPGSCGAATVTAPGVWYYFAGTDQDATFSTCGTADYDTKISVFSGSCGDLTCVDGNDDGPGCSGFTSELEVRTYVGTDYYVYVHGFSSQTGNFDLSVTCADTCEAITIEVGDITDVACSGPGGIDITVTSGVEPFDYLWSDGSTDEDLIATEAGDYSVTVTGSDGCVATAGPFEILEEPAPGETAPPVVTSPGCSFSGEGSIDVTIGGGTPPYSFLWSNGEMTEDISGLAADTYTLTVTDSVGCTYTTQDFVLTETNELIELAPAVITPVDCFGNATGAIDITVGGGTPPYTYRWSNDLHTEDVEGLAAGEYVVYVEDATGCTYTSAIILVTEPDLLVVSGGAIADADCNGASTGSVTGISVTGGTEPYSYLWSDGTTTLDNSALAAGTHQLTVTDANGCETLSAFYLIQEPLVLTVTSIVVTDALCNGEATGAIDIEVNGGTPPYSYAWDNGETTEDISGLFAGDYTGTITDAAGCVFEGTITVGEPDAITISAVTVTDASCNGGDDGAIDISVAGGTPPYTYAWDNGETTQDIDGLSAGDYSGTITDANGCIFFGTIPVGEPDVISVTFADVTDISCNGESDGAIDIEIAGGTPPYDYSWSNGATTQDLEDLGLGVYVVTITDINGCTFEAPGLPINQPAPLVFSVVDVTDNLCFGDENGEINIEVVGGTEPYTYSWDNGSTDEDLSGLAAGFYTGTVTDANGCVLVSPAIEVESPFVVFEALPAVVSDVSCNGETDGSIDITLEGGTLAYDILWSNGANTEDPTDLEPGDYFFTVTDFNGCIYDFGPITVGEPDPLMLLDASLTNVACFGASTGGIDVTIGGGTAPYTYMWSDGSTDEDLTGVPAGDYIGTVTDANGCSLTSPPVPVSEPATALEATGESTPASDPGTSDGSVTVTVTGGDGPYDFLWNTGDVTQDLDGVGVGTFCADITDANDCTIELCVEVGLSTAVLDIFQISDLVLYPNPSTDVANLKMSFTTAVDVDIQLTDVIGRILETTESLNVIEDEVTFDVRDYAAGTYFIKVSVEGAVITLPFVVQH